MTKPTAKDFDGALTVAMTACRFMDESLADIRRVGGVGNADDRPEIMASSLLRQLLDSEFLGAALEWNRTRQAMSNFGKDPTTHMDEWHALSHAHMEAEKLMRSGYRRLTAEPSEGGGE